jgi:sigma-B regulation protein RsbU (phosphoserine phosphatase)
MELMTRLGLFVDLLSQPFQNELLLGVEDECRRLDTSLYCLAGGLIDEPQPFYELVGAFDLDGIIVSSGTLARRAAPMLGRFLERYRAIPLVSVSVEVDGLPSVLIDNVAGIRELTQHLIDVHGRRRIAFVRVDHPEGELRFAGYRAALGARGLPLDPELVVEGEFTWEAGVEAVRVLFDERKTSCDAIVASSDWIAIGALHALRQRGISVPDAVAITGFDDVDEARFSVPSITTVYQPVRELGAVACRLAVDRIQRRETPLVTKVRTRSEYRQSCGCGFSDYRSRSRHPPLLGTGLDGLERERVALELLLLEGVPELGEVLAGDWPAQLLEALSVDLRAKSRDRFLLVLRALLSRARDSKYLHFVQRAISSLFLAVEAYIDNDPQLSQHAQALCEQAHVAAAAEVERIQGRVRWDREHVVHLLNQMSAELRRAFNSETALGVLVQHLERLDVPSCYVAAQAGAPAAAGEASLMLAYERHVSAPGALPRLAFRAGELVPMAHRPGRRHTFIIEPLWFGADTSGFCALERGPSSGLVYETVRELLNSSFYAARLVEARVAETSRRERAEHARLEQEMRLAARIQASILPRTSAARGYHIAAAMQPATEVGGDYFDVLPLDTGCWIGIGDVAGHGFDTGIIMLMIQAAVAGAITQRPNASPVEIWRTVNSVLYENVRRRLNRDEHATLTLLCCDQGGRIAHSGAHEDLLVYRSAMRTVERFASTGIWVGIMSEPEVGQVEENELRLWPGDVLLLHTDGVTEAVDSDGQPFGLERLLALLRELGEAPVEQIQTQVMAAVDRWAPTVADDRTIVVLRQVGDTNTRPIEERAGERLSGDH